jgi:hypothetical protein
MTAASEDAATAAGGWRKLAALLLALAVVGLPVNSLGSYVLLLAAAVVIFSGAVSARAGGWLGAIAVVVVAIVGQFLLAPPRLEEGHNVFLPDATVLQQRLPADVYKQMAQEFDTIYPPAVRCKPGSTGCWQDHGRPDRLYAFSADSIWHNSDASRAVTALDFSDPVWLRLGFINELNYNWFSAAPDAHRADRDRRFWMGFKRWHLAMPWFEKVSLPAALVGGQLCWRGEIMWEGAAEHFTGWPGGGCRTIESSDAGRRVFGIAIAPATLAMDVKPPWPVQFREIAVDTLAGMAVFALLWLLVSVRARRLRLPTILIALAVLMIAIDDASFLGGVRPFDSGDDGLFYDSVGREILQHALSGNWYEALRGGESVFWYGGPGLRYARALEHVLFGETYLGYLSLILLFPFAMLALFHRFLTERWALALVLLYVAVPIGALFGTTFIQYAKLAAKGFADPAAYIFFFCALLPLIDDKARSKFFGALLLALAIFMKPVVAPAAAVLMAGVGLAALYRRQWTTLAALCVGFLLVFSMALHNWVYGHVFVLFSSNAQDANLLVMPPSAYVAAARDMLHLDFSGAGRVVVQLANWLSGPAESYWTIPLNAAGVTILIYVVVHGRRFDPYLRLIGAAALAQHTVAFFYVADVGRYHYLSWILTMLVVMTFLHEVGIDWLRQRFPELAALLASHPLSRRLASGLTRLQKSAA